MKCVRAVSKQTVHGHVCVLTAHVRARQCSFIVVFLYFVLFMFFFLYYFVASVCVLCVRASVHVLVHVCVKCVRAV